MTNHRTACRLVLCLFCSPFSHQLLKIVHVTSNKFSGVPCCSHLGIEKKEKTEAGVSASTVSMSSTNDGETKFQHRIFRGHFTWSELYTQHMDVRFSPLELPFA
ncbi:hypothetical protein CEXT_485061 [Caerostris extrusa]|uniref:Secreted protein n=1 Tax=Caerostris extrusa TaxID=172846 RepID=A0AAV4Q7S5_CAEEX|nr:hypothetical protein CEXT_485061 [Caerostris extrusa]